MLAPAEVSHPLESFLTTHRKSLAGMAQAWLDSGAAAFGMSGDGQWLALWPETASLNTSGLSANIVISNRVVGDVWVFGLANAATRDRLQNDAQIIAQLASQETELNNVTFELIDAQDQLLALYDLTQSMRNRLTLDEALSSLVREVGRLVKANACSAYLAFDPPAVAQHPQPMMSQSALQHMAEQVIGSGTRMILNSGGLGNNGLPAGMQTILLEPIMVDTRVIGALCLLRAHDTFRSPDLKLTRAVCDQAGAQFENLLRYKESLAQTRIQTEMELAKTVQTHLLPQRLPAVAGLDIAAGALPASQVGGDFYDFIHQPGEPFIFTVGDITGKGMSAALLMAMTRTLLRSKTRAFVRPSPLDILGSLNDEMYDDFTELSMFATVFVGQYDDYEKILYYANAGHSPVIYCPAGGEAVLLEADGAPVGVLPTSTCENQAIYFNPGDLLVAATDGFSEASNRERELFGYDRLLQLVTSIAHLPAQTIMSTLFTTVAEFSSGRAQDDDQTVVVIKGV
ncbi:MAG: SpoIIE family protein phosphatase [Chloroflexi bacterium]|nr:SpoIIE family protein phosphatase [Chloroflexota bacterium]